MSEISYVKNFIAEYSAGNKKVFPYLANRKKKFNPEADSVLRTLCQNRRWLEVRPRLASAWPVLACSVFNR